MVFCQFAEADSLREICGGLSTAMGKLTHVGLKQAPSRSTSAYANEHRHWQLFESVFYSLCEQATLLASQQKRRFRFKNPLMSIDASTIDMCLSLQDWQNVNDSVHVKHLAKDGEDYVLARSNPNCPC